MSDKSDGAPGVATSEESDDEWGPGLDAQDLAILEQARNDPDRIIESTPKQPERLGYCSVVFLILNRCIGTGVFNSASVITANTQSLGVSLIFWMCGCIVALAGTYIYIELGLTIPRWTWHGEKISTPCSGGELNYLKYILKRPSYLSICFFGISFIVLGNTAANSIAFGQNVFDAAGKTAHAGTVCLLAIAANTFACMLHVLSRRWGIRLNNILGLSKLIILVFLITVGFIVTSRRTTSNLDLSGSFKTERSTNQPYRYAEAFLFAIFPFGGFHQANYVLAEIDEPKKIFKRSTSFAMILVCVLFMLVNIAFTIVVPKEKQFSGVDIGQQFFNISMGTLAGTSPENAQRVFSGLRAVSSLGNIIVVTFTAARVKQEIAKEGILPFSLFFAKSYDLSVGRLFRRRPSSTSAQSEKTPVAAMLIHWTFTTIIVIAAGLSLRPRPYNSASAYTFIVAYYAYVIDVVFFTLVGLGVLYLRLAPGSRWRQKSKANHWISILAALVFVAALVFPLLLLWIPDPEKRFLTRTDSLISWYVPQTVGVTILAASLIYWFGFRYVLPHIGSRGGKEFTVEREPIFHVEHGYPVQVHETIRFRWKVKR